ITLRLAAAPLCEGISMLFDAVVASGLCSWGRIVPESVSAAVVAKAPEQVPHARNGQIGAPGRLNCAERSDAEDHVKGALESAWLNVTGILKSHDHAFARSAVANGIEHAVGRVLRLTRALKLGGAPSEATT